MYYALYMLFSTANKAPQYTYDVSILSMYRYSIIHVYSLQVYMIYCILYIFMPRKNCHYVTYMYIVY